MLDCSRTSVFGPRFTGSFAGSGKHLGRQHIARLLSGISFFRQYSSFAGFLLKLLDCPKKFKIESCCTVPTKPKIFSNLQRFPMDLRPQR